MIRIEVPPLRQRREDIPELLQHYLDVAAIELGRRAEGAVGGRGARARRVRLARQRAAAGQCLPPADGAGRGSRDQGAATFRPISAAAARVRPLPTATTGRRHWRAGRRRGSLAGGAPLLDDAMPEFERTLLREALKATRGGRQEAAKLLGWGRNTLTRKLKELGPGRPLIFTSPACGRGRRQPGEGRARSAGEGCLRERSAAGRVRVLSAPAAVRTPWPLRVSRASLIARRNRAINGDPCSSGHSAMVPAQQQNPRCRLVPALELRRSTRSGQGVRTAAVAASANTRMTATADPTRRRPTRSRSGWCSLLHPWRGRWRREPGGCRDRRRTTSTPEPPPPQAASSSHNGMSLKCLRTGALLGRRRYRE